MQHHWTENAPPSDGLYWVYIPDLGYPVPSHFSWDHEDHAEAIRSGDPFDPDHFWSLGESGNITSWWSMKDHQPGCLRWTMEIEPPETPE